MLQIVPLLTTDASPSKLPMHRLSPESQIVATSEQMGCELDGEAVILNLRTGVYFGLNPVGTRVWEYLREPRTVDSVRTLLLEEYDVDVARCDRELFSFLDELASHALLEPTDASAA